MRLKSGKPATLLGAVACMLFITGSQISAAKKNIIMLIPDGSDASVQTVARWYKGSPLMLDSMRRGAVKTWCANSIITGSAAAATAFATGFKTTEPFVGVGPRTSDAISTYEFPYPPGLMSYRPLATVLEGAKAAGKATGLVATATISHATPASFGAHIDNRNNEQGIIEHLVHQNINVVFGGAREYLTTRTDGENLRDTLISRGYQWVETRNAMLGLHSGNVWGMFAGKAMQPDIDRAEFAPAEPSLAEMTQKAIELLSQDPDGFFLMVEGSQVDWAGHNNDPIYRITDYLAFDEAVRVAVEFARRDTNTIVLAFPDHNTGGMTIGSYYSDSKIPYDSLSPEALVDPLRGMLLTSVGVSKKIADTTDPDQIRAAVQTWWNISLTDDDVDEILNWPHSSSFNYRLATVVSKNYTAIGWTTHGHNGGDVPLWYYESALVNNGGVFVDHTIENTSLAKAVFAFMGIDRLTLNVQLFVDIAQSPLKDFWSIDSTDSDNPVLVVSANGFTARLPISKDEAYIPDHPYSTPVKYLLDGLVVYAPATNRVYLPETAISLILSKYGTY